MGEKFYGSEKGNRVKVVLACTECKQRNYDTYKNSKNTTDRLEMHKYCRFCKSIPLTKKRNKENTYGYKNGGKKARSLQKIGRFLRKELERTEKVSWPTFKTVLKNTGIVLLVVLFFGVIIFGFDSLFSWLIGLISNING